MIGVNQAVLTKAIVDGTEFFVAMFLYVPEIFKNSEQDENV